MRAHVFTLAFLSGVVILPIFAQPALVSFSDCTSASTLSSSTYDPQARINITSAYAQILSADKGRQLKIVVIGDTGDTIVPSTEDSNGNVILC